MNIPRPPFDDPDMLILSYRGGEMWAWMPRGIVDDEAHAAHLIQCEDPRVTVVPNPAFTHGDMWKIEEDSYE